MYIKSRFNHMFQPKMSYIYLFTQIAQINTHPPRLTFDEKYIFKRGGGCTAVKQMQRSTFRASAEMIPDSIIRVFSSTSWSSESSSSFTFLPWWDLGFSSSSSFTSAGGAASILTFSTAGGTSSFTLTFSTAGRLSFFPFSSVISTFSAFSTLERDLFGIGFILGSGVATFPSLKNY